MSRTQVLAWTAALLLPNLLLLLWWFRELAPHTYLNLIYSCNLPIAFRASAISIVTAAIGTLVLRWAIEKRVREIISTTPPFAWFAAKLAALWIVTAIVIGVGFFHHGVVALAGAVVVIAAIGAGLRLLQLPPLSIASGRFDSPLERLVLSAALGLGILALMMFILGSLGLMQNWLLWLIIVALIAASAAPLLNLGADLQNSCRRFLLDAHPLAIAAFIFIFIWALIHLPLLWAPPLEYDVLEYHLGAPVEYLRDGRISFLRENTYGTFAQNSEMLYLLGMILGGGKWTGMPVAHAALFAACMLSLCAVYALSARLVRPNSNPAADSRVDEQSVAPALAVVLFALIPLSTQLSADFYVEHFQSFFHLAALTAACGFWRERKLRVRERYSWLILAGLIAGIGCGTKYTSLLFTLAPLLILIPVFCLIAGSFFEALGALGPLALSALFSFAPWLVRNFAASGDPIHPLGILMKRRISHNDALIDHLTHFEVAHRAGERSPGAFVNVVRNAFPGFASPNPDAPYPSLLRDGECGPQLFCFALPGFCRALRGEVLFVALYFLLSVLFWFLFTYRLNRFLFPLLGPLAVISAVGIAHLWLLQPLRKVMLAIVLGAAIFIGPLCSIHLFLYSDLDYMGGIHSGETAAREHFKQYGSGSWFEAWDEINALPENSKVLFIGDAQTLYVDQTPDYSVVFNTHVLEDVLAHATDAPDVASMLAARGITHIYINWAEWLRLDLSYAITRRDGNFAPAKIDGRQRELLWQYLSSGEIQAYGAAIPKEILPAYLKLNSRGYRLLDELLRKHTVIEAAFPSAQGSPSCELRRLVP